MPSPHQQRCGPPNELHEAALYGCPHHMMDLLEEGSIDIDQGTPTGCTPLMLAAQEGRSDIARILLERGANVSIAAHLGFTALHIAAQQGHRPVVVDLVNAGAEVNACNHNNDRALHLAGRNGHSEVVRSLIKAGADVEVENVPGFTPLHISAQNGQWKAMKALIAAGANVDSRVPDGATSLYLASERGHTDTVRGLLRAKANALLLAKAATPQGGTRLPLDVAALGGHSGVVLELMNNPGGIESCGGASGGVDALRDAAENGHLDILAMLTAAGVVDDGAALVRAAVLGVTASAKFLLRQHKEAGKTATTRTVNKRAYVDARHPSGGTPLFVNIMLPWCSPKMVRLLVEAGADTASAFPVAREGGYVFFNDTALALATFQLRKKMVNGEPATEEQLHRLEAIRRLLLREEAVHAVSWLWTSGDVPDTQQAAGGADSRATATPSAPLTSMLSMMRRRARRRGVLLQALFRNARKP